jgi:NAD(P)-dependent dehydrogenase (short-subunit alcohol dehydrogenase family)
MELPKDEGETMVTMQGKVCPITGGTNGIGKSTVHELARTGATVVIGGRDAQIFTMESVRHLEGTGVTVNALHPGFVSTGFVKTPLASS